MKSKTKVFTYPFDAKEDVLKTSWGRIVAKSDSMEIHFDGLGTLEIFGAVGAEIKNGEVDFFGTEYESNTTLLKGKMKS